MRMKSLKSVGMLRALSAFHSGMSAGNMPRGSTERSTSAELKENLNRRFPSQKLQTKFRLLVGTNVGGIDEIIKLTPDNVLVVI